MSGGRVSIAVGMQLTALVALDLAILRGGAESTRVTRRTLPILCVECRAWLRPSSSAVPYEGSPYRLHDRRRCLLDRNCRIIDDESFRPGESLVGRDGIGTFCGLGRQSAGRAAHSRPGSGFQRSGPALTGSLRSDESPGGDSPGLADNGRGASLFERRSWPPGPVGAQHTSVVLRSVTYC